jgi:ferredoxin-NADP reductase
MTVLDPLETDSEGNTRTFSIASAPHEETLMVATRMRDTAFKRVLRATPLGTTVKIEGPFATSIDEEFFIIRSWLVHVRELQ